MSSSNFWLKLKRPIFVLAPMAEINRRRTLQIAYNKKHGIVAETVRKDIEEFLVVATEGE